MLSKSKRFSELTHRKIKGKNIFVLRFPSFSHSSQVIETKYALKRRIHFMIKKNFERMKIKN